MAKRSCDREAYCRYPVPIYHYTAPFLIAFYIIAFYTVFRSRGPAFLMGATFARTYAFNEERSRDNNIRGAYTGCLGIAAVTLSSLRRHEIDFTPEEGRS